MIEIQTRRLQQFQAWNKTIAEMRIKVKNRFHESTAGQQPKAHESSIWGRGIAGRGPLKAEFEAWDAASDDALAALEDSLE